VRRTDTGELEPVDHNTIVDVIPGDPGYSPFWAVIALEVTDRYAGELITSFAAIDDARALGLVGEPELQSFAVNCPAVASDVRLEVDDGAPLEPPSRFFWRGRSVRYYDLGPMPLVEGALAEESMRYVLARVGEPSLSEPRRGVDMTGDGDLADTNDVFEHRRDDAGYSPLCRTIEVTVPASYRSIDTARDQTIADARDASALFDPAPVPGVVVAFERTEQLANCPQQSAPGGL
jgi:hypothetical protein